jgi:hypothetical protein
MAALGLMALLGFCLLGVYAVTALVQWVLGWPIKPAAVLEAIAFKIGWTVAGIELWFARRRGR